LEFADRRQLGAIAGRAPRRRAAVALHRTEQAVAAPVSRPRRGDLSGGEASLALALQIADLPGELQADQGYHQAARPLAGAAPSGARLADELGQAVGEGFGAVK